MLPTRLWSFSDRIGRQSGLSSPRVFMWWYLERILNLRLLRRWQWQQQFYLAHVMNENHLHLTIDFIWVSQGALVVKNLPANAEDSREMSSIPGSRRSPGGGKWQPALVLLLGEVHGQRILVGYIQSMGLQRVRHDWATEHTAHRLNLNLFVGVSVGIVAVVQLPSPPRSPLQLL